MGLVAEQIAEKCLEMLRVHEIEAFGTDKVRWIMSPVTAGEARELDIENRLWGYPVHFDDTMPTGTVLLVELLESR